MDVEVRWTVNPDHVDGNARVAVWPNVGESEWPVEVTHAVLVEDERVVGLGLQVDHLVVHPAGVGARVPASGVPDAFKTEASLYGKPRCGPSVVPVVDHVGLRVVDGVLRQELLSPEVRDVEPGLVIFYRGEVGHVHGSVQVRAMTNCFRHAI